MRPHFTSSSGSLPLPPTSNSLSVTPPRRTLYPSGGAKRTGDGVTPGVPGRGGRRSLPQDSQRTRSLPQPRAPQSRGLTPSAPTPNGEDHRRPAGAQLSRGQLWRVGEEALGSRHRPRSGSRSLWHRARTPRAARLGDMLWARELLKGVKLSD